MCGIAGILRFDDSPPDARRIERMRGFLRHRGPDGDGVVQRPRCTLIHTRLNILDPLGGAQPMSIPALGSFKEKGELTLVFNGEIYNHHTLRKQLESLGHRFVSDHSDTEVLLHGYREWGKELPKRLHGMFAFAIWDAGENNLFLCRDRVGKKPLYLRWSHPGDDPWRPRDTGKATTSSSRELMFGSLVSTIVAGLPAGESPRVDDEAMLTFLRLGYTFGRSLVDGVTELPAAHWLIVRSAGRVECDRYWRPPPVSRTSTSMGAKAATRELLEEAVAKRLEADVPLGCFLSGGIDSSVVAALAQRQLKARGGDRLKTFCVAMPDLEYDESAQAQLVADHLETRHHQLTAEPHSEVISDLRRLISVMGEPTADSSILPTYWLCKTARADITVALCGDGGDELFGGYDRYRALRILERHRWWLRLAPLALLRSSNPRSKRHRFTRLVEGAHQRAQSQQYRQMVHLFSDEQIRELATPSGSVPSHGPAPWSPPDYGVPVVLDDWPHESDPAHAAMRWDLMHYLPFDLLRKMDRASMAVALEVRCPILDTQVLDLAGHLPTSVLMPHGRPKGLLREIAADLLPASIVNRPKRGFALPIGRWFRGPLRAALTQQIIEGDLASLGINRYVAEALLDEHHRGVADHTHRLFALLMLSLWSQWLKSPTQPPVGV